MLLFCRSGYPAGSLVVYGMNMNPSAVNVSLGSQLPSSRVDRYMLTPVGDLTSK